MSDRHYETISLELSSGLLILHLDRPDKLNAFTVTMSRELAQAFRDADADDAVKAIIVTGRGKAFCAGMDLGVAGNVFGLDEALRPTLEQIESLDPDVAEGVRDTGGRVTLAMFACRKPIIGAINGVAVGIGATMTLAMDIRLASSAARFGFVFGKLGIVPEACSTWFLPRIVGLQQALEWVYSADIFDAEEALRGRLVRSVHAPEALLDDAIALARKMIDGRSPVALALARQMLLRNPSLPHPFGAHAVESLAMFYTSLADGKEGVAAFREKRPPCFEGRASAMPPFYEDWVGRHGAVAPDGSDA